MTLDPPLARALARLYLSTVWVEGLPLPADAPDDGYLLCESVRIYAGQIRAVREARLDLYTAMADPALGRIRP
jgi:hypothetical protein